MENSFQKGMLFEVSYHDDVNRQDPARVWVARVVMVAGRLLFLSWLGSSDTKGKLALDAFSPEVHALGWSKEKGKPLEPPKGKECYKLNMVMRKGYWNKGEVCGMGWWVREEKWEECFWHSEGI